MDISSPGEIRAQGDNADASICTERQHRTVPGDNDLRGSRKRAFQSSTVGLVGKHSQRFGWPDEFITSERRQRARASLGQWQGRHLLRPGASRIRSSRLPSGAKVYVVQTRFVGSPKRITVGRHGDVSPDQARKEAARIIARIKDGETPIPVAPKAAPTMAELAERYRRTCRDAPQAGDRCPLSAPCWPSTSCRRWGSSRSTRSVRSDQPTHHRARFVRQHLPSSWRRSRRSSPSTMHPPPRSSESRRRSRSSPSLSADLRVFSGQDARRRVSWQRSDTRCF